MQPRFLRAALAGAAAACALPIAGAAAPRDVQIREIDFTRNTIELKNFGATSEPLSGWRLCTHDANQVRQYTSTLGFDGLKIAAGASLFIHVNNDAQAIDEIDLSSLGGGFAFPFDSAVYAIGVYFTTPFDNGANLADHLQWSIGGADDETADDRSDEAEGEVWSDQTLWVSTVADSEQITLNANAEGVVLHGPGDYTVVPEPGSALAAASAVGLLAFLRRRTSA